MSLDYKALMMTNIDSMLSNIKNNSDLENDTIFILRLERQLNELLKEVIKYRNLYIKDDEIITYQILNSF